MGGAPQINRMQLQLAGEADTIGYRMSKTPLCPDRMLDVIGGGG